MVLNAAARMVVGIGKYEHITPMLRDTLHWLPVTARIQLKITALTFEASTVSEVLVLPTSSKSSAQSHLSRWSLRSADFG